MNTTRHEDLLFLTPEEKTGYLADFEEEKGLGKMDPELVGLCDDINRLPGIVTLFSCQGHPEKHKQPSEQLIPSLEGPVGFGYLTLKMDRVRADAFREHALVLRNGPWMLGVDISFENDWGERQSCKWLRDSRVPTRTYDHIRKFLRSLNE